MIPIIEDFIKYYGKTYDPDAVDEIAAYLGIKRDTVYRWTSERNMPGHKIGRLWKFRKEEVDEWMRSGGGQSDAKDKPVDAPQ